jgi:hypothetical protein
MSLSYCQSFWLNMTTSRFIRGLVSASICAGSPSGCSTELRNGAGFGLTLNEGPTFRRIRRVSAVRPLSNPVERGGLWTGPDGRSDYSEVDRGAQKRGGFSNGPEHNGPGFCTNPLSVRCQIWWNGAGFGLAPKEGPVFRRLTAELRNGAGFGLTLNEGPTFRRIRRVSAVRPLSNLVERGGHWTGPDSRSGSSPDSQGFRRASTLSAAFLSLYYP